MDNLFSLLPEKPTQASNAPEQKVTVAKVDSSLGEDLKNDFHTMLRTFFSETNIIDFSIAFVLGSSTLKLFESFVSDILIPMIGIILPSFYKIRTYVVRLGGENVYIGCFFRQLLTYIFIFSVAILFVQFVLRPLVTAIKDPKVDGITTSDLMNGFGVISKNKNE